MPLVQRILTIGITASALSGGSLSLTGLRSSVHLTCKGGPQQTQADILIWGMPLQDMNALSTLGQIGLIPGPNSITVTATDNNGTSNVFKGQIYSAISDFQGGPNLPFHILALGELLGATKNMQGTSRQGQADINQLLSSLASNLGLTYESSVSGVSLYNPWYNQSVLNQIHQICNDANVAHVIDPHRTLAVWPLQGSRSGSGVMLSPTTGLIGYPSYSAYAIRLKMIYNPSVTYGGNITVTGSSITPANKTWVVWSLEHILEAFKPNGQWFTIVECYPLGNPKPSF